MHFANSRWTFQIFLSEFQILHSLHSAAAKKILIKNSMKYETWSFRGSEQNHLQVFSRMQKHWKILVHRCRNNWINNFVDFSHLNISMEKPRNIFDLQSLDFEGASRPATVNFRFLFLSCGDLKWFTDEDEISIFPWQSEMKTQIFCWRRWILISTKVSISWIFSVSIVDFIVSIIEKYLIFVISTIDLFFQSLGMRSSQRTCNYLHRNNFHPKINDVRFLILEKCELKLT